MQWPAQVWLVRHAETTTPAIFHGAESDIGLSDLGRQQASTAGEWFRDLRPTAVVSSAMRRAVDTAAPIAAACEVTHHIESALHERRIGSLSGTSFSSSEGAWAETIRHWSDGDTAYTTPGAESFDDIARRVLAAWNQVITAHPGGRVIVVAHGVVCKVLLLSLLEGWDSTGWVKLGRVANLAVSELHPIRGSWHAEKLLFVPEPVAALTAGAMTGVGSFISRSEA